VSIPELYFGAIILVIGLVFGALVLHDGLIRVANAITGEEDDTDEMGSVD